MTAVVWGGICIAFILLEMATVSLVSVWFAAGAFVDVILTLLFPGTELWLQVVVFLAVSVAVLLATRPLVKKWKKKSDEAKTNFDRIIGMSGVVQEPIDNLKQTGYVSVDGKEWMARTEDGAVIEQGALVRILKIEGAKIIVERQ